MSEQSPPYEVSTPTPTKDIRSWQAWERLCAALEECFADGFYGDVEFRLRDGKVRRWEIKATGVRDN